MEHAKLERALRALDFVLIDSPNLVFSKYWMKRNIKWSDNNDGKEFHISQSKRILIQRRCHDEGFRHHADKISMRSRNRPHARGILKK